LTLIAAIDSYYGVSQQRAREGALTGPEEIREIFRPAARQPYSLTLNGRGNTGHFRSNVSWTN
jgi:hypothetical protein